MSLDFGKICSMKLTCISKLIQVIFSCYLGYEEIDWYYPKNQSGMYYSLFSAAGHKLGNNESSDGIPLIVWFQGGPGGSSQYGAFQ